MYKLTLRIIAKITRIVCGMLGRSDKINTILCYHAISDDDWEFSITRKKFLKQINSLREKRQVVRLSKLLSSKDKSMAVITFDDGYESVYTYAYPIIKNMGLKGCVFINNPSIGELNGKRLMDYEQIKELIRSGWEIGYHTKSHIDCTNTSSKKLEEELKSVIELESKLKIPIKYFAYPHGRWNEESISLLKKYNFTHAFTADSTILNTKSKYLIPRTIVPNYLDNNDLNALTSDLGIMLTHLHSRFFELSKKLHV